MGILLAVIPRTARIVRAAAAAAYVSEVSVAMVLSKEASNATMAETTEPVQQHAARHAQRTTVALRIRFQALCLSTKMLMLFSMAMT